MAVVIVDYGMGNLRSVLNKVKKVTGEAIISSDPSEVLRADKLILPGVGHFGRAVERLRSLGLFEALDAAVREKKRPILGICLGMQLLTRSSEEGDAEGFAWIDAETRRFRFPDQQARLKLPHIGWNDVRQVRPSPLFDGIEQDRRSFYFVHSFHAVCRDRRDVLARAHYGYEFDCAVSRENIIGTQFHPEKSHAPGMQMLRNFVEPKAGSGMGPPGSDALPAAGAGDAGGDAPADRLKDCAPSPLSFKPRIMPCLLLRGQGLVKTVKFKDPKYVGDPINAVRIFNEKEVDELLFLDITATAERRGPNLQVVRRIAEESYMPLTVGGGVASTADIRQLLNAGAEKVAINTAAVMRPELIRESADIFGSQCIVASLDVRRRWTGGYEVYTHGGTRRTRRTPVELAQQMEASGAGEILINAIDRDGTMSGFDTGLTKSVAEAVNVPVIACGGAGKREDFTAAFREGGASAAAAGSYFVFHGPRRAVLISFPSPQELNEIRAA